MRKDERKKLHEATVEWEVSHILQDKLDDIEEILEYWDETFGTIGSDICFGRIQAYSKLLRTEVRLLHRTIEQANLEAARKKEANNE